MFIDVTIDLYNYHEEIVDFVKDMSQQDFLNEFSDKIPQVDDEAIKNALSNPDALRNDYFDALVLDTTKTEKREIIHYLLNRYNKGDKDAISFITELINLAGDNNIEICGNTQRISQETVDSIINTMIGKLREAVDEQAKAS